MPVKSQDKKSKNENPEEQENIWADFGEEIKKNKCEKKETSSVKCKRLEKGILIKNFTRSTELKFEAEEELT